MLWWPYVAGVPPRQASFLDPLPDLESGRVAAHEEPGTPQEQEKSPSEERTAVLHLPVPLTNDRGQGWPGPPASRTNQATVTQLRSSCSYSQSRGSEGIHLRPQAPGSWGHRVGGFLVPRKQVLPCPGPRGTSCPDGGCPKPERAAAAQVQVAGSGQG